MPDPPESQPEGELRQTLTQTQESLKATEQRLDRVERRIEALSAKRASSPVSPAGGPRDDMGAAIDRTVEEQSFELLEQVQKEWPGI
jgi:hypothetical protein